MKIKSVTPVFADRFLYAVIETEDGLTGYGECGAWGQLEPAATAVEKCGDYLVGKDAGAIEHHWNVLTRWSYFRGAALYGAVSAIDVALWDIKGKAFGVPVHVLLGGPTRRSARVYAHVKAKSREEMIARCLELKDLGFTAIGHLNPFLDEDRSIPYDRTHARKIDEAVAVVRDLREALGPEVDLCIEIHRRLTPAEAIVFGNEIAPYRPMFYEDPMAPTAPDSMARIAEKVTVPIATGERLFSPYEFQTHIARKALAYARISVCLCGGITGARKIAALAEAQDIQVIPHNPLSPISLAACLQLDAAIPNFAIQEYPTVGLDFSDPAAADRPDHQLHGLKLVDAVPPVQDGFINIPSRPGIGMNLVDDIEKVAPKVARRVSMRAHRDGFVVDQ
ncbi:mandelate racemase/muconate lactonizing enzyme family protein [Pelagibius sp.]|uniref:mandelate racemase/muconate lactonizing enzyme family protein n=1 Tax=Pelagibius sp. TaxID=1931238 RepID=UPI003BB024E8